LPRSLRHRGAVVAVLGLVTLLLAAGVPRLSVQDSWESGFAPKSVFRRASDRANRLLAGTHTLLVEVAFPPGMGAAPPGGAESMPLLRPGVIRAIGDFETFLAARPGVGRVLGLFSHVTTTRYLAGDRREDLRRVPDRPSFVRQMIALEGLVRGEERRRELVDRGFRHTVITVLLEGANYRDTKTLLAAVRGYAANRLAPLGATLRFGGDVAVSQAMIPAIVHGQIASLGLALAGMLLMSGLLYGSVSVALVVVAPVSAAVLWVFGLMGWLGLPLGVATSMFCAVTLGIGIDYAIHLFDRYRTECAAGHPRPGEAAIRRAGPAILADAAAIAVGFGILAFSRVPANRALGLLIAGALGVSCLLTLVGQGAWLTRLDE
jgi:predicted RND superfamily exporter protein